MQAPQAKDVFTGQLLWDQGRRVWIRIDDVDDDGERVRLTTVFGVHESHRETRVPVIFGPEAPDA